MPLLYASKEVAETVTDKLREFDDAPDWVTFCHRFYIILERHLRLDDTVGDAFMNSLYEIHKPIYDAFFGSTFDTSGDTRLELRYLELVYLDYMETK